MAGFSSEQMRQWTVETNASGESAFTLALDMGEFGSKIAYDFLWSELRDLKDTTYMTSTDLYSGNVSTVMKSVITNNFKITMCLVEKYVEENTNDSYSKI